VKFEIPDEELRDGRLQARYTAARSRPLASADSKEAVLDRMRARSLTPSSTALEAEFSDEFVELVIS